MIRATQEAYPGRPIRLRKLHRVGIQFAYASGDYTCVSPLVDQMSSDHAPRSGMQGVAFPQDTNYFTDMRIAQLRVAQEAVAKELGIHVFDFGAIFEGWQECVLPSVDRRCRLTRSFSYQDKVCPEIACLPCSDHAVQVHPLPLPGVFAYALPLLHHIWMESQVTLSPCSRSHVQSTRTGTRLLASTLVCLCLVNSLALGPSLYLFAPCTIILLPAREHENVINHAC